MLVLLVSSLISYSALADDQAVLRVEVKKGETFKVPEDGQYLSKAAVAKLLADFEKQLKEKNLALVICEKNSQMALELEQETCEVKLESAEGQTRICEDTCFVKEKLFSRSLNDCAPKWYESPYFHLATGLVTGLTSGIFLGKELR